MIRAFNPQLKISGRCPVTRKISDFEIGGCHYKVRRTLSDHREFYIFAVVILFMLMLLVGGCTQDSVPQDWVKMEEKAKAQDSITLYVFKYADYFLAIAEEFTEETGIQVTVINNNAEGTYQKLVAEKDDPGTIDIWLLSGPQVQSAIEEGLLYGPLIEQLPNAENITPFDAQYAEGFDHGGYVAPAWRNQAVFAYDSQFLSDPPSSLAELENWVQSNPGRFTYCDPARGGSGQAFVNSALYWLTGDPERYFGDFDQSIVDKEWPILWSWLQEIGSYVVYSADNNASLERLSRGEVWIAVTWEEMYLQWRSDGRLSESIKTYIPESGLPGGADFLGIHANASNKEAAFLFINDLLTSESQNKLMGILGMRPVRTDIQILPQLDQLMISWEDFEQYRLPWPHPGYKMEYKARWVEEVPIK